MNRRTGALFFASLGLAAAAAVTTSEAAAKWTRTTPWACHVTRGIALDTNWALQNDSTQNELIALCPIADTDYLLKEDLAVVNVHVRDGNGNATARAMLCESNYTTAGGACSAAAISGNGYIGNATLSPETSQVWSQATRAYFGYLFVGLPRKSGNSRSNFRGYYTRD